MRKLLVFAGFALLLSGCGWLNPNIMLKTGKDFQYTKFPDSTTNTKEYRLSPNDLIEFNIYSNDGFKLVDLTSSGSGNVNFRLQNSLEYLIDPEGFSKLPILGRTKISGYTIKEAQVFLEEKYAAYYIKPFVIIRVINKRVIIFPGNAGSAKVINLSNNNTSLIEVIALAGGITDDGKAKQVKLIRNNTSGTKDVFLIDLSKIEGIKQGSMVVQANDIIYIEPRRRISNKLVQEIAPVVSILSSIFVVMTYSRLLSR